MSNFFLKVGDTKPSISATLTVNGAPIGDLMGATVKFKMRDLNGVAGVYKVNATATVVDNATCAVRYDWVPADVDTVGTWIAEWFVTYADTSKQTVPNADCQIVYISPRL